MLQEFAVIEYKSSDITIEQIIEAVKSEDLEFLQTALEKLETKEPLKDGRKATNSRSA